jgi:hypothetical protein
VQQEKWSGFIRCPASAVKIFFDRLSSITEPEINIPQIIRRMLIKILCCGSHFFLNEEVKRNQKYLEQRNRNQYA